MGSSAPSKRLTLKRQRTRLRWVAQLMVPGRREWDVPLLLFPNDINEILKTRLAGSRQEDHIAWHYVKSGIFSVHSAYHLVVQIDQAEQNVVGCSSRPDGSRPLLDTIWTVRVPP
jgi:hypothetical protein